MFYDVRSVLIPDWPKGKHQKMGVSDLMGFVNINVLVLTIFFIKDLLKCIRNV